MAALDKSLFGFLLSSFLIAYSANALIVSESADDGSRTTGRNRMSSGQSVPEWQILTKKNFSSEIKLHQHILLMVTVPWSGESRTLMKKVAHLVDGRQEELGHLRLMVVYRNTDKMVADVLGAVEEVTLFYYYHSIPYKYQGRLRAQNVLSSVYHLMTLNSDEVPLKLLYTKKELEFFFQSTDRAILLIEFCGWSTKLLHKDNDEKRDTSSSIKNSSGNVSILGETFSREADVVEKRNKKVIGNEELTCEVEAGHVGYPWIGEVTFINQSNSQNRSVSTGSNCTLEEYQRFETFFSKFIAIARDYFLPPERQRFGLISDRSLLPILGFKNPETWMLMLQSPGCPKCSMILQEGDDLESILKTHHSLVMEVDTDEQNSEPAFPANRPSVILFLDRSADSSKVRGESKSSLESLRKFALQNQPLTSAYEVSSRQVSQGPLHKGIKDSATFFSTKVSSSRKIVKVRDNMAILIKNEDENTSLDAITADAQANPAYSILAQLLSSRKPASKSKETKISLLAKEVGFHLLSDDFEVEMVDSLPAPHEKGHSSEQHDYSSNNNVVTGNDESFDAIVDTITDDVVEPALVGRDLQWNQEAISYIGSKDELATKLADEVKNEVNAAKSPKVITRENSCKLEGLESSQCLAKTTQLMQEPAIVEETVGEDRHGDHIDYRLNTAFSSQVDENLMHPSSNVAYVGNDAQELKSTRTIKLDEPNIPEETFSGSFFFVDGGYHLLGAMTGGSKIPSLVILDPVSQQHYIFSGESDIGYSSLVSFVEKYVNGSLTPYQRSESSVLSSRDAPRPPFVNLDFHEADAVPRVTAKTFCELVSGSKACEGNIELLSPKIQGSESDTKLDILVLFTNSWCGFCQRMELIVREVYRAFNGLKYILRSESANIDHQLIQDRTETTLNALPSILLMDCTLNDCDPILKLMDKKEHYPTLLLFPAGKDVISYEGDISVNSIINFLISHGSSSPYLSKYKGSLWSHAHRRSEAGVISYNVPPMPVRIKAPYAEDEYNELTSVRGGNDPIIVSHTPESSCDNCLKVVVGSVLVATDKLLNAFPFGNSTILIVSAEKNQGFDGLIMNKPISWEIFKELEELEPLKQAPLYYGGPVRMQGLPFVSLSRKAIEGYTKAPAGLYVGDPASTNLVIEKIKLGELSPSDCWFFLGFSRWGWNQLFDELDEGAWVLSKDPVETIDWPDS